jgi:AcrR family transcriptional regulator
MVQDDGERSFIEAARRRQIIACAIDAIAELGYQRASLYEIASRAKVSKSVISYYFTSKDELIREVVAEIYEQARAYMLPQMQAVQGSIAETLRMFIRSNVAWIGAHRNHARAMIEITAGHRPGRGDTPAEHKAEESVADLEHLLRLGQESGEFRAFRTDVMALALRVSIDVLTPRMATATPDELDHYADELVELFDRATRRDSKQQTANSKPTSDQRPATSKS